MPALISILDHVLSWPSAAVVIACSLASAINANTYENGPLRAKGAIAFLVFFDKRHK